MKKVIGNPHDREGELVITHELEKDSVMRVHASEYPLTGTSIDFYLDNASEHRFTREERLMFFILMNQAFMEMLEEPLGRPVAFACAAVRGYRKPCFTETLVLDMDFDGQKIESSMKVHLTKAIEEEKLIILFTGLFQNIADYEEDDLKKMDIASYNSYFEESFTYQDFADRLGLLKKAAKGMADKLKEEKYGFQTYCNLCLD